MNVADFAGAEDLAVADLSPPLSTDSHPAGSVADVYEQVQDTTTDPIPSRQLRGRRRYEPVPVMLVDRSALCRAGLRHILSGSRFRVIAEYDQLSHIQGDLLANGLCVVLVGLDQDAEATFARFRLLKSGNPDLRILALSNRLDPEQLVTAFNSGVNGYLLHDEMVPETVLRALELVLVDGTVVPRGFTKLLGSSIDWALTVMTPAPAEPPTAAASIQALPAPTSSIPASSIMVAAPPAPDQCLARLSDREQLILGHLTRGASNKRIARDLNIAEATVKAHIKSVLRKLRVNNRTQAALWAINHTTRAEPDPTQSAAEP